MRDILTRNHSVIRKFTGGTSNSYMVCAGDRFILTDTGNKISERTMKSRIERLRPAGVKLHSLVLTHTHHDHVKNAASIKKLYDIDVFAHESEIPYLEEGFSPLPAGTNAYAKFIMKTFSKSGMIHVDPLDASPLPASGTELMPGFKVLYTPGHTKGSVSFIVDDEIALVGDTLFAIMPFSVYPPFADDTVALLKSWKLLLDTNCSLFLPGHGGPVTRKRLELNYKQRAGGHGEPHRPV